jgi:hypothetical protein
MYYIIDRAIVPYTNEYQTKKIKTELQYSWGLVHYARWTHGFYVSFKLSLEELIFEAEKRRKSVKEKQRKREEKETLDRVLSTLGTTRP